MELNQVTVPVTDVARSIQFYQQIGLRLIVEALPRYARFECGKNRATFSLHLVDELPKGNGVWVYFETEKLDETVEELIRKGIAFEEMPNDKSWLWREARLRDPDNNQLIFYYAGSNRLDPPWKINK
ncbi:VOC family protein [Ferruginibacter sp. HRS2-29]|uniref:VOC family protein n=1 Tax=Ferruginibacter sp. HRS2-29 TaxID=2487334 RepID=UPI0020CCABAE|nr:VOC family protein [Ferruginibacter sp. HRS2-29]MCP9752225.1 VOC family protein [Ferruginibacter sp. HRS2-29]